MSKKYIFTNSPRSVPRNGLRAPPTFKLSNPSPTLRKYVNKNLCSPLTIVSTKKNISTTFPHSVQTNGFRGPPPLPTHSPPHPKQPPPPLEDKRILLYNYIELYKKFGHQEVLFVPLL